jgi:thiol:disulfide interchange protein DsbC
MISGVRQTDGIAYNLRLLPDSGAIMLKKFVLFFAFLICGAALADEASVRKLVEAKLGTKVQSVTKTPYGGLYEVYVDKNLHYTDEKVSFIVYGVLIDTKTDSNVTEQRIRKLTALNVAQLPPLTMAMKRVKGDGKRVLRVFSDPMCPFCKKLEVELDRINNVTIYVYPFPIEAKFPGSTSIAKSIWCSSNNGKAWEDWMLRAVRPSGKTDCANPIEQVDAYATKLNIDTTPTLVFSDGGVLRQYVGAADIERFLNDTPK